MSEDEESIENTYTYYGRFIVPKDKSWMNWGMTTDWDIQLTSDAHSNEKGKCRLEVSSRS